MNTFILDKVLARPIAFHRVFANIGGGATGGLFLSQAYYWSFRTSDPDGWFYKIGDEWEAETALNRREQEQARKILAQKGVLETKKQGLPCKLFYRVNRDRLYELITEFSSSNPRGCQFGGNVQTSMDDQENKFVQNDKQLCTNSQTILYTENTSKTTLSPLPPKEKEREFGFQVSENSEAISQSLIPLLNQPESTQLTSKSVIEANIPAAVTTLIKYDPALGIRPPRQKPKFRYPDGPWLNDSGQINEDFVRDRAALWRVGDTTASKSFGAMAIEDVIGLVAGHYQRLENHAKLETDWTAYVAKNQRYVSNVQQRLSVGIEMTIEEQHKILQKAPALTADSVEPVYGVAVPKLSADINVPRLELVATVPDDIWDAVEAATQQHEQVQLVSVPENAVDAAMYITTAKSEDVDYFRALHEKHSSAIAKSKQPESIKNIQEFESKTSDLIKRMAMPSVSYEERQRMREEERLGRKLAHWHSLLQTGIPSVIADVHRQINAQGYQIVDGQILEVDF